MYFFWFVPATIMQIVLILNHLVWWLNFFFPLEPHGILAAGALNHFILRKKFKWVVHFIATPTSPPPMTYIGKLNETNGYNSKHILIYTSWIQELSFSYYKRLYGKQKVNVFWTWARQCRNFRYTLGQDLANLLVFWTIVISYIKWK